MRGGFRTSDYSTFLSSHLQEVYKGTPKIRMQEKTHNNVLTPLLTHRGLHVVVLHPTSSDFDCLNHYPYKMLVTAPSFHQADKYKSYLLQVE